MASESFDEQEKLRLEEKKVLRKVDWILMPILTITLGLQVGPIDRAKCITHNAVL